MSRNRRFPRSYRQRGVQTLLARYKWHEAIINLACSWCRSDGILRKVMPPEEVREQPGEIRAAAKAVRFGMAGAIPCATSTAKEKP